MNLEQCEWQKKNIQKSKITAQSKKQNLFLSKKNEISIQPTLDGFELGLTYETTMSMKGINLKISSHYKISTENMNDII